MLHQASLSIELGFHIDTIVNIFLLHVDAHHFASAEEPRAWLEPSQAWCTRGLKIHPMSHTPLSCYHFGLSDNCCTQYMFTVSSAFVLSLQACCPSIS